MSTSLLNALGKIYITSILPDKKFQESLINKLDEECSEFKEEASVKELADILEVVDRLREKLIKS